MCVRVCNVCYIVFLFFFFCFLFSCQVNASDEGVVSKAQFDEWWIGRKMVCHGVIVIVVFRWHCCFGLFLCFVFCFGFFFFLLLLFFFLYFNHHCKILFLTFL